LTELHNERGLSIGALKNKELKMFCLQVRGVDKNDISQLQQYAENVGAPPVKVLIEVQHPIKYCPFCGTRLDKLIAKRPDILDEIERKSTSLP
jgi:hypothetical protein